MTPPPFIALDFETANTGPTSVVAIGLVRVDEGVLTHEIREFVRPETTRFTYASLHGIEREDVADASGFADVWRSLEVLLRRSAFIAAHNAKFDQNVLLASCARAQLATPRQSFVCTMGLAREVWGTSPASLPAVCQHLGLPLEHHDPLSDARACAMIVLAAWATKIGHRKIARLAQPWA